MEFADKLRRAMSDLGLKPVDVADRTGFSKQQVSRYLSGQNTPRYENIERIADGLGISVVTLMDLDEDDLSAEMLLTFQKVPAHMQWAVISFARFIISEEGRPS